MPRETFEHRLPKFFSSWLLLYWWSACNLLKPNFSSVKVRIVLNLFYTVLIKLVPSLHETKNWYPVFQPRILNADRPVGVLIRHDKQFRGTQQETKHELLHNQQHHHLIVVVTCMGQFGLTVIEQQKVNKAKMFGNEPQMYVA